MNKKTSAPLFESSGAKSALSSLIAIGFGLLSGCVLILLVAAFDKDITLKNAFEGIRIILLGVFSKGRSDAGSLLFGFSGANIGNLLFRATPIIMTGLSVALAFKSGLFNIGASGQYLMGTAATLIIALSLPTERYSPLFVWLLAFIGSLAAGALWGMIPGFLRAYFNINEVLSCIMTNWIAANLVTLIFENSVLRNSGQSGKIGYIFPTSANSVETPTLGLDRIFPSSQVNAGIIIAVFSAVFIYVLLSKTVFGFELKICGSNRHAAEYAGIRQKRKILSAMAISGALSGAAAALYYLSGHTEFFWSTYQSLPKEGLNGIPVALLASNNPLAVVFTGLFMSFLGVAGQQLKTLTSLNEYITDIIIAFIVYLSAFSLVIKQYLSSRKERSAIPSTSGAGGKEENIIPTPQGVLNEESEGEE